MSLLKSCGGIPTIDLTQGQVAHYLLNNNADDNFGTYDGTNDTADFQGDRVVCNGTSQRLEYPYYIQNALVATSTYTASFWVTANSSMQVIFDSTNNDYELTESYQWSISATNVLTIHHRQNHNTTGTRVSLSEYQLPSDGLYHVTIVNNGYLSSDRKIYINGTLITHTNVFNDSAYGVRPPDTDFPLYSGFSAGLWYTTADYYTYLNMSNVRFYNEAKNQTFIDALYAEGYYPKPLPLPTTDGLIAHHPLTGTAEDTTGNYNGTEFGGLTYVDDAEFGSVANFDGVDDYATTCPSIVGNSSRSFSIWFKTNTTTRSFILGNDSSSAVTVGQVFEIVINALNGLSGSIEIHQFDSIFRTTVGGYNDNEWHNIVISHSVGNLNNINTKVYIDDVLQTMEFDASFGEVTTNTIAYTNLLGKRISGGATGFLNGMLSDFREYNRALTQQEITDIYNYEKNFRPIDIDDGLVAYYPLANNSLDNYKNQYDGVDTSMTYDGLSGVFNGIDSYINTTASQDLIFPAGNTWSYGVWVSIDPTETKSINIGATKANSYFIAYVVALNWGTDGTDGRIMHTHYTSSTATNIVSPSTLTVNKDTYYHLFATCDGNTIRLYLNGIELASGAAYTSGYSSYEFNDGIGRYNTWYIKGKASNVRMHNKTLTQEQVKAIYNSEKGDFEI